MVRAMQIKVKVDYKLRLRQWCGVVSVPVVAVAHGHQWQHVDEGEQKQVVSE